MVRDFDKPYNGKSWADLTPTEREAAIERHYVSDVSTLTEAQQQSLKQWDDEAAAEILAKEAAAESRRFERAAQAAGCQNHARIRSEALTHIS